MISMARNDLHFVRSVSGSDMRLIRMACEQLAYSSLKNSSQSTHPSVKLTDAQLVEIKKRVDEIGMKFCFRKPHSLNISQMSWLTRFQMMMPILLTLHRRLRWRMVINLITNTLHIHFSTAYYAKKTWTVWLAHLFVCPSMFNHLCILFTNHY